MSGSSRVLLVTGTRTGLGRGLATYFLERGWVVEGCSRGKGTIEHERYGHEMLDVTDERAVHGWVRRVARNQGRLDAAVANAAHIPQPAPAAASDGRSLSRAVEVNAQGSAAVLGAAARVMLRRGAGSLVAVSSMATAVLQPGTAAYAASKAAVETWVKVLARELAPAGINCNIVAPSVIETEALEGLGEAARRQAIAGLAIRRALSVDEVGGAVEFLVSPAARVITGQVIYLGLVS